MALMTAGAVALAASFTSGDIYYTVHTDGTTVEVTKRSQGYSGNIVIPATVANGGTTYTVTAIGNKAFYQCAGLGTVTLPSTITHLGQYAFAKSNIKSLYLPNSLTSIDDNAFWLCTELQSIIIPNSVTTLGLGTFTGCAKLASVTLSEKITEIGVSVFADCTSLTALHIPKNVQSIAGVAFEGCTALRSITVDVSNAYFKAISGVLMSKDGLSIVRYPPARSADSYVVPEGVTRLGLYSFESASLSHVTLPSTLASMASFTFSKSNIEELNIPSSLTYLESSSLWNCYRLTAVNVDPANTAYCSDEGVLYSGDKTRLIIYPVARPNESYSALSGVSTIVTNSFADNLYLRELLLPEGAATIQMNAFENCHSLERVTMPSTLTSLAMDCFKDCAALKSIDIPDGVTAIPQDAFSGCSRLASARLGRSVKTISPGAFRNCVSLASVNIPSAVTLLGGNAFLNCRSLTSITIPAGVVTYGAPSAFSGCTGLTTITSKRSAPVAVNLLLSDAQYQSGLLRVPRGSGAAYRSTASWSSFAHIEEYDIDYDLNNDGATDSSDVSILLEIVLEGGSANENADINLDGTIDSTDVSALLEVVLAGAD